MKRHKQGNLRTMRGRKVEFQSRRQKREILDYHRKRSQEEEGQQRQGYQVSEKESGGALASLVSPAIRLYSGIKL